MTSIKLPYVSAPECLPQRDCSAKEYKSNMPNQGLIALTGIIKVLKLQNSQAHLFSVVILKLCVNEPLACSHLHFVLSMYKTCTRQNMKAFSTQIGVLDLYPFVLLDLLRMYLGVETCSSLIVVMNCLVLSAFVGGFSERKKCTV